MVAHPLRYWVPLVLPDALALEQTHVAGSATRRLDAVFALVAHQPLRARAVKCVARDVPVRGALAVAASLVAHVPTRARAIERVALYGRRLLAEDRCDEEAGHNEDGEGRGHKVC